MPLKAKKPEVIEKRLKLFLYGPAGVGKTTAAIQFPNAYIIDMERGTENYSKTISRSGSAVMATTNPDEVKEQIKALLTEKHEYRTLIIDPITSLYNALQEKWARIFEKHATSEKQAELQDFGMRYWGRIKSEYKSIQRMLMALDMNVIITSHQKDIYGTGMTKIGEGPDSMKGDSYFFDYIFQLGLNGSSSKRMAKTIKERAEIGENKFPSEFEWSYKNFLQLYGADVIEKESTPVPMATIEQVEKVKKLLDVVKVSEEEITKWFDKAEVTDWDEMTSDQIEKVISYLSKKLGSLKEAA